MTHKFNFRKMEDFINIIPSHTTIIRFPKIKEEDMRLPDLYIEMRIRDIEALESSLDGIRLEDLQKIGIAKTEKQLIEFKDHLLAKYYLDRIYFTTILINRSFSEN